jgi:NADPH-dependent curcumin reductase CurA
MALDESVADLREHFGALGMNGWTALLGVRDAARIQPRPVDRHLRRCWRDRERLPCRLRANLGAHVVGRAGGPAPVPPTSPDELGADVAIDYKSDDIAARLAAEVPGGLDGYFDNVGGPIRDAILPNMALFGCVAVCWLVAAYDADNPLPGPARYGQVLMKRLRESRASSCPIASTAPKSSIPAAPVARCRPPCFPLRRNAGP